MHKTCCTALTLAALLSCPAPSRAEDARIYAGVEIGGKVIVFSGDTNGEGEGLVRLAKNADLFVAHNAVPEGVVGVERRLHMPPSVIGQIAEDAKVKQLVLSHRMLRTLGNEDQTQSEIRRRYSGPLAFANDLGCFAVK